MPQKTILLIDDELAFLEPLEDALTYEGYRVLKARDATTALQILRSQPVHLVSIDVMLSPGSGLEGHVNAHEAGLYLCRQVAKEFPDVPAFCLSVVNDGKTIRKIEHLGIRFLRKGETPLRTVLNMIRSRLTGLAYSSERDIRGKT